MDKYLSRELTRRPTKRQPTYRKLLTKFSCNINRQLTKVRMLIELSITTTTSTTTTTISHEQQQYYVVTIYGDLEDEDFMHCYGKEGAALKKLRPEDVATSFVLQLPPKIKTVEAALTWANDNMRGHCKDFSDLKSYNISEERMEKCMYWFCDSIKEYRMLKNKRVIISDRRHASYLSNAWSSKPTRLSITPDGVCVFAKYRRHTDYAQRGIICENNRYVNYLGLSDATLFGYPPLVDESIKEVVEGICDVDEVWDLETSPELNVSGCSTMSVLRAGNEAKCRLVADSTWTITILERLHSRMKLFSTSISGW